MPQVVEGFRLSPQQRLLWRRLQEDGTGAYGTTCAVRLVGALDEEAWRRALSAVVERHEILRTSFRQVAGMSLPVQVVEPPSEPRYEMHDLGFDAADRQPLAVANLVRSLPSAEGEASPLSVGMVRLSDKERLCVLRLPALCSDARGLANLVGEIAGAYAACKAGAGGGEEPAQYADVAEVFNGLLESEEAAVGVAFWRGMDLSRGLALHLPWRHQSSTGFAPRKVTANLPEDLLRRAEAAASGFAVELPELLFACWQIVLWRLTGGERIVVGRAFDGRGYEGLEEALGLFARYVPVVADLGRQSSLSAVVAGVRAARAEAEDRQECFDWEELADTPSADGTRPYFPVCFDYRLAPARCEADGVAFEITELEATIDRFEIRLGCLRGEQGLDLELAYDAALYPEPAAEQLLESFSAVIDSAGGEPGARIGDLDILGARERQRLGNWNGTRAEFPRLSVHRLFEEQVDRTPEWTAVLSPEETWTYAELNRRANRIAHALIARGVGSEDVVAVHLERVRELPLALLAVLKTGAAYLPLDPAGPRERSSLQLQDAGASLVLTATREVAAGLGEVLLLSDLAAEGGPEVECNPGIDVLPEQLAYVLFTSGSTGRPKGVMVGHGSFANYLAWVDRTLLAGTVEDLPLTTRPTFDASFKQIFAPLLRGGRVWILPSEVLGHPAHLLQALAGRPRAGLNCVTSLWRAVVDACDGETGAPTAAFVGGEKLDESLLERSFGAFPEIELWNLYGPTEATANATAGRLSRGRPVDLGRPVGNARVYLLDEGWQLVPSGVPGQICVGGAGVARGYRGLPGLTAERFIPDAWSGEPGARLYQTGDLARFRADGSLEYLGRSDHQVKVRGIRIELGEIEAVLRRHPAVADCAVVLREIGGEPHLVGYVEPTALAAPSVHELRVFLAEQLPEVMVPADYVVLRALPRTSGGKVDRQTLPEPDPAMRSSSGTHVAPRSAVEEVLAEIWCDLLGLERAGAEDDFLQLGGHSLLAVQLLARIQKAFRVEVPLRAILDVGNLAAMAAAIEVARSREGDAAPPLVAWPERDGLPLSLAQERLWFMHQLEPDSSAYNLPATARLRGALDPRALARGFDEVVRRHEVLRTNYETVQGRALRVVHAPAAVPMPLVDLGGLPAAAREAEALSLVTAEAERPFDLASDPLLRRCLLCLDDDDWILLATCHHIVSDGWSMRVLFQELGTLYQAFSQELASHLPELPIQYADYAAWQRHWLQGDALARRQELWRRRLTGLTPTSLPADKPRPEAFSSRSGAALPFSIPADLGEALRSFSRREGSTLFLTLLAALKATLHASTGASEIVLGIHAVNRGRPETERLIGLFANQLVLRTDLSGDPSFRELLERVRETALEAYEHQEMPLNLVIEAVRPERSLGRNPLFQMMFPYQNLPELPEEFADLSCEPIKVEASTAPFDLSVHVRETGTSLDGFLRYNTDLYQAASMERFRQRFENTLRQVVELPEVRLAELARWLEEEEWRSRQREAAEMEKAAGLKLNLQRRRKRL